MMMKQMTLVAVMLLFSSGTAVKERLSDNVGNPQGKTYCRKCYTNSVCKKVRATTLVPNQGLFCDSCAEKYDGEGNEIPDTPHIRQTPEPAKQVTSCGGTDSTCGGMPADNACGGLCKRCYDAKHSGTQISPTTGVPVKSKAKAAALRRNSATNQARRQSQAKPEKAAGDMSQEQVTNPNANAPQPGVAISLPDVPGWDKVYDPRYKAWYYQNKTLGLVQWEVPTPPTASPRRPTVQQEPARSSVGSASPGQGGAAEPNNESRRRQKSALPAQRARPASAGSAGRAKQTSLPTTGVPVVSEAQKAEFTELEDKWLALMNRVAENKAKETDAIKKEKKNILKGFMHRELIKLPKYKQKKKDAMAAFELWEETIYNKL